MLKSLLQRAREARAAELGDGEGLEEGFTLIELMVVLLIIAILLAIAIPTFLGVTNSASDRAAQSNLTNGLTEAKAIYQNNSSYYPTTGPANANFASSAPEFGWVQGATTCTGSPGNCMSEQVVDVAGANDGQGVVLAAYSPKDSTCWYALDLEATPVVDASWTENTAVAGPPAIPADIPFAATALPTGVTTAGVFYAKQTGSADCSGNYPVTHAWSWGGSYATAPVA
jgi:prepilin-type N-terminal cleavage/methylation domain-containing protein